MPRSQTSPSMKKTKIKTKQNSFTNAVREGSTSRSSFVGLYMLWDVVKYCRDATPHFRTEMLFLQASASVGNIKISTKSLLKLPSAEENLPKVLPLLWHADYISRKNNTGLKGFVPCFKWMIRKRSTPEFPWKWLKSWWWLHPSSTMPLSLLQPSTFVDPRGAPHLHFCPQISASDLYWGRWLRQSMLTMVGGAYLKVKI